jgi:hypothetical protein|tara:strand:+ start:573 stop:830 length:258 start_codon:yes stop_codon:yes gene_type:complete
MTKNMIKHCISEKSWFSQELVCGFGKYEMSIPDAPYMIRMFDANDHSFIEMYADSEEELDIIEWAWKIFVKEFKHILKDHLDIMQ